QGLGLRPLAQRYAPLPGLVGMTVFTPRDPARAVLFDFGGVLTTSVLESFSDFSEAISGDRRLVLKLLMDDPETSRVLVEHEEERIDHDAFETGLAAALVAAGVQVDAHGLVAGLQRGRRRDEAMIDLLAAVRALGFKVGLVSNSLGR